MLAADNVLANLLSLGLISSRHLVEEGLSVRPGSARNQHFVVELGGQPTWFVKYFREERHLLRELTRPQAPGAHLPPVVHASSDERWIAFSHLRDAITLEELMFDDARSAVGAARVTGEIIAGLQRSTSASDEIGTVASRAAQPWAWLSPPSSILTEASPAQLRLLNYVQSSFALRTALGRLQDSAQDHVAHGDLRPSNILILKSDQASSADPPIALVDWEFWGIDRRAGDWAMFVAQVYSVFFATLPVAASQMDADQLNLARLPIAVVRDCVREFSQAFLSHAAPEVPREELGDALVAALLQAAWEVCDDKAALPAPAGFLIHLSENLARDPAARIAVLLDG